MNYCEFYLKCDDIEIKNLTMDYLKDFHEYASQKEVAKRAGWKPHKNIRQSEYILREFINSELEYGIFYENKLIGIIGVYEDEYLYTTDKFKGKTGVEVGYSLNQNYWSRGIMTKVLKRFVNHLLTDLKFDYVSCSCFLDNERSIRVIKKCGFEFYGKHFYRNYDGKKIPCFYFYIENESDI